MSKKITLGENLKIDLPTLIDTRLLIQANSGSGKSWTIRKLLEETHGEVQQIVLDLEGEFRTLREKFDYILIGKGGDLPTNVKSAELLAQKLLELNVSAIIDLYELKHQDRKHFVKLFLNSMINAPKELWHPVLVVIDEAHIYAPEKGESEASEAVIDLCTRGRKRGFCVILASQRLSKLNKDCCAECNNKILGRCTLDIDMKRSGEELGFTSKSQMQELRTLKAGEFFVFGTAISDEVKKATIGKVKTTHLKAGSRQISELKIPSSNKIKQVLSKLADLPQEAEKELKTKQDMVNEINRLKAESRKKPIPIIDEKAIEREKQNAIRDTERRYKQHFEEIKMQIGQYQKLITNLGKGLKEIAVKANGMIPDKMKIEVKEFKPIHTENMTKVIHTNTYTHKSHIQKTYEPTDDSEKPLDRCARMIYGFLMTNSSRGFTKQQIGAMIGYSPKSSGFVNALSKLNTKKLIKKQGKNFFIDEIDENQAEKIDEYSIDLIKRKMSKCEREILEVLLEEQESEFSKEELAEKTKSNYSPASSGFVNAISKLNSLGFIEKNGTLIKLSEEIKELL